MTWFVLEEASHFVRVDFALGTDLMIQCQWPRGRGQNDKWDWAVILHTGPQNSGVSVCLCQLHGSINGTYISGKSKCLQEGWLTVSFRGRSSSVQQQQHQQLSIQDQNLKTQTSLSVLVNFDFLAPLTAHSMKINLAFAYQTCLFPTK